MTVEREELYQVPTSAKRNWKEFKPQQLYFDSTFDASQTNVAITTKEYADRTESAEFATVRTEVEFDEAMAPYKDLGQLKPPFTLKVFRDGVPPVWEHAENINGGHMCFLWHNPVHEMQRNWDEAVHLFIRRNLEPVLLKNVCGITLSVKLHKATFTVWLSSTEDRYLNGIRRSLRRKRLYSGNKVRFVLHRELVDTTEETRRMKMLQSLPVSRMPSRRPSITELNPADVPDDDEPAPASLGVSFEALLDGLRAEYSGFESESAVETEGSLSRLHRVLSAEDIDESGSPVAWTKHVSPNARWADLSDFSAISSPERSRASSMRAIPQPVVQVVPGGVSFAEAAMGKLGRIQQQQRQGIPVALPAPTHTPERREVRPQPRGGRNVTIKATPVLIGDGGDPQPRRTRPVPKPQARLIPPTKGPDETRRENALQYKQRRRRVKHGSGRGDPTPSPAPVVEEEVARPGSPEPVQIDVAPPKDGWLTPAKTAPTPAPAPVAVPSPVVTPQTQDRRVDKPKTKTMEAPEKNQKKSKPKRRTRPNRHASPDPAPADLDAVSDDDVTGLSWVDWLRLLVAWRRHKASFDVDHALLAGLMVLMVISLVVFVSLLL